MKGIIKIAILIGLVLAVAICATSCSSASAGTMSGKQIVRVAHMQSETHPEAVALKEFEKYVEKRLGDKYDVQIYPNGLLGNAQGTMELTQTGAVDYCVVGSADLESFDDIYEGFSIPYLFANEKAYHATMNDLKFMRKIYNSTDDAGFRVVEWFNAGTRNFYAKKPIRTPEDLKGMKIRVRESQSSVSLVKAFGAAATPLSFGEVYTAIQQGVIDGAENNELALTENKHGEVAKYFSYTEQQMTPDFLIANLKFLQSLPDKDKKVFDEAAQYATKVELKEWDKQIKKAKESAEKDMGVKFLTVDRAPFKAKTTKLRKQMLKENPDLHYLYDHVQKVNKKYKEAE